MHQHKRIADSGWENEGGEEENRNQRRKKGGLSRCDWLARWRPDGCWMRADFDSLNSQAISAAQPLSARSL